MKEILTKGNVIVNNIKVGDKHFEFQYGVGIEVIVKTLPVRDEDGLWSWVSTNVRTNKDINYAVREGLEHYGPNLYDYRAYEVKTWM